MSEKYLQVSNLGEKKLIERIIKKSKDFSNLKKSNNDSKDMFNDISLNTNFTTYIGDDSALINFTNKEDSYLVATSDILLEKSHFPKQMSYFQMGWKAVIVNVSDLAAMGASPSGILISLAIPPQLKLIYFDEIIDGILKASYKYNIPLIGGDTNQADEIIISGTALGKVKKTKAMKKSGFKKGDLIAITGDIGLAALGFEILKEENIEIIKDGLKKKIISQEIVNLAIKKALQPKAKLNEGIILNQFASSATDITDGLASELYELYNADKINNKESNLGLKIYENKITNLPSFKEIYKVSKILNKDPLELILHIGEDFELLFTFNKDITNTDNKAINNVDFIILGEINNSNRVEIEYSNGKIEKLSSKGYEHLKD